MRREAAAPSPIEAKNSSSKVDLDSVSSNRVRLQTLARRFAVGFVGFSLP
jgi:hypothetical protein